MLGADNKTINVAVGADSRQICRSGAAGAENTRQKTQCYHRLKCCKVPEKTGQANQPEWTWY